MFKLNKYSVKSYDYHKNAVAIVVIALVGLVGVLALNSSHAATPYGSVEASAGTLSGSATKINDNQAVQFGKTSSTVGSSTVSTGGGGTSTGSSSEIGTPTTVDGTTCSAPTPVAPVTGYNSVQCQDFNDGLGDFGAYDGGGSGTVVGDGRVASQCTVSDGYMHMVQSSDGATCGGWMPDFQQQYGLWEVRMRAYTTGTSGSEPHPVMILWPSSGAWTSELDWFETDIGSPAGGFLHCTSAAGDASGNCYVIPSNSVDFAQWHVYSILWTPTTMSGYIDGTLWWTSSNTSSFQPLAGSYLTLQLDNLSGSTPVDPGEMDINWVHMFAQ
jgi:hypothetical protein